MKINLTLLLTVLCFSNLRAQEEGFEFINPPVTFVVLGSSTAEGIGTSPRDSAWVNRYRKYVKSYNPNNEVINLGKGGFGTYKILPTDSDNTKNRPTADTTRNFTKALQYQPDGIIINLPSNDVANGYSVEEQLANFRYLAQVSKANEIELWVTTTQARNFPKEKDRLLQRDLKDSIIAMFPNSFIDFWSGFSDEDFRILKQYDSGDGCHMNNGAHRILKDRVIEAQAFQEKLYSTAYQREIAVITDAVLPPYLLKVGFRGKIESDSANAKIQKYVTISQENRTIKAVPVNTESSKYKVEEMIDLRYPVVLSFEAPNSLTKAVELRFDELVKDEYDNTEVFYPLEDLSMQAIFNQDLNYQFPNNYITVAKFHFDSTRNQVRLDGNFTSEKRQRLLDAFIKKPVKGRKSIAYWENGNKKYIAKFKKGVLNGKSKFYREDGTKERFVNFKNGAYHGKYITFDAEGEKETLRIFENDDQVGGTKRFE